MKGLVIGIGVGVLIFLLTVGGLIFNRWASPFKEETRRVTYQESVTAQTACRQTFFKLYREWSRAEGAHKRALELSAQAEADRVRCDDLGSELETWVRGIR